MHNLPTLLVILLALPLDSMRVKRMALSRAIQKAFCLGPLRVNGLDLMLAVRYYNDVMRERNIMSASV